MIYLASVSPRRKALLKKAGIAFKVIRPSYVEVHRHSGSALALTKEHALGKSLSVMPRVRDGIILGADTVVLSRGIILGKPRSMRAAERMLEGLLGRAHTVVTAVALLRIKGGRLQKRSLFAVKSRVFLKKTDPVSMRRYLKRIGPLDKAGAYAAQAPGAGIVDRIEGSFSNVVGLPIEKLQKELRMLR